MEGNKKPKISSLILSPFRRKNPLPSGSTQATSSQNSQTPAAESAGSTDLQRTRYRYNYSVKFLQDTIEAYGGERWRGIPLPKLGDETEGFNDSQLTEQIDETLKALDVSIEDQDALRKCGNIIQCMFTALSPLAKNLLTIASTASNVHTFQYSDNIYLDPCP